MARCSNFWSCIRIIAAVRPAAFDRRPILGLHACVIAAHFKNGKTKHFLSEIPREYKSGKTLRLKKCQWSYGAPGHSKGVWDGFGGMVCTNLGFKMAYEP